MNIVGNSVNEGARATMIRGRLYDLEKLPFLGYNPVGILIID